MIIGLGSDFWVCLFWVIVFLLDFCFLLDFWRMWWLCVTYFADQLCWCVHSESLLVLEAGILGRGGRRNIRGDGLRHPLRVGSERKGSRRQFPVTELEMRLGNGSKKQEEGCGFTFSLLGLAEDSSSYWRWSESRCGKEVRSWWFVISTGDVGSGEEKLLLLFCCSTTEETGDPVWGNSERRERSVCSLPVFLDAWNS